MIRGSTLMDTIRQYPPELLALIGEIQISDSVGLTLMECLTKGEASAGSDGSVKDGIGGHAFCITYNDFST